MRSLLEVVPLFSVARLRVLPLAVILGLVLAFTHGGAPAHAQSESPAAFMNRVAKDLIAANRSRSPDAFAMALRSHMDVPSVGLTALGPYIDRLPKGERPNYYSAMIQFISRYAAKESTNYAVAKAVVTGQSPDGQGGALVDTSVTMSSGMSYDVRWKIIKRGNAYKVRDAQVIGIWMTPFINDLFQKHIAENGNNPRSLVTALNMYR
jgi:phospholipid transport system substrate-binding protein